MFYNEITGKRAAIVMLFAQPVKDILLIFCADSIALRYRQKYSGGGKSADMPGPVVGQSFI